MAEEKLVVVLPKQMEQMEAIQVSMLVVEVRLRQGVEVDTEAVLCRKVATVAQPRAAGVAEVSRKRAGVAVVRQAVERTVLLVFLILPLEQLEQGGQVFHSRFLNTMEEVPKSMVWVEMVE